MALNTVERPPRRPPAFFNQVAALLLRSPLHGPLSKSLMLLTFTGHKSGKSYRLPVGYTRQDDTIKLFTDHNWWKNFRQPAPVTVRVQGKNLTGTAVALHEDKEVIAEEMRTFVQHLPGAARAYGVTFDAKGQPNSETLHQAAQRFVLVRIQLDRG